MIVRFSALFVRSPRPLAIAAILASACDAPSDVPELLEPEDEDAALEADAAEALVAPGDPSAMLPGFPLQISASASDVTLSWSATGTSYEVWRSSEPYFTPGDPGSELRTTTTGLSYVDSGATCLTCDDRYYVVRATTATADVTSTTVGAHIVQVYDGYNKIPVSLINPAFNQGVHLQTFGNPGFIAAYRWMAATQTWQAWTPTTPFVYLQVVLGESPVVHLTLGPPSYRVLTGTVPAPGDFGVDLLPGDNLVVLPLSQPDTLASELLASIPQATRIGRWDPVAQTTHWYDGQPGNADFVIPSGRDLHVQVTSAGRWPLPEPEPTDPPASGVGGSDYFQVSHDRPYNSAGGALLANDAPGTTVVGYDAQSVAGGAVMVLPNGSFSYTPPTGRAWGDDSFHYTASDGASQEVVTVELFRRPLTASYTDVGGILAGQNLPATVTILGDVNGDGLDDVGWSGASSRAYVAFGTAHPAPIATTAQIDAGVGGFYIQNAPQPRQVGDVNGDGLADVLVGNGWPGRITQNGQYNNDNWLVFGKASTTPVTPATLAVDGGFHLDLDFIDNDSSASYTGYGYNFALTMRGIGDFDGDGLGDFAVSAGGHDWPYRGAPGYINNAGVVFVVRGKAGQAEVPLPDVLTDTYAGSDVYVFRGNTSGAYCSFTEWLRDADGDGRSDILLYCAGNRYLVRGRPHPGGGAVTSIVTNGSDPGISVLSAIGPTYPQTVQGSLGDFNGDGLTDAWRRDGVLYGAPGAAALSPTNLLANMGGLSYSLMGDGYYLRPLGDADGDGYDDAVYYQPGYVPMTMLVWGRASGFIDWSRDSSVIGGIQSNPSSGSEWDGAGDVDGDGFDEATLSYQLVMGDRFTDAVDLLGQDGDDALVGTAGDDVAVGGRGDDVIELGTGVDAARGGAGDDTFVVEGLGFRRIDGGNGEDTLAIVGAGSDLDLAGVYAHRLQGIEVLDLTDAGATTLTLRALDVARLSRTSNTLTILGGDDVIVVAELAGAGFVPSGDGTWSNGVLTLVVQGGTADVSL